MKKQILLIAAFVVIGSVFMNRNEGHTFSTTPPVNRTGAPGQQACSGCHGMISPMLAEIDFMNPDGTMTYVPGTTYDIEVNMGAPTQEQYGFSMIAWDDNNDFTGDWIASGSNTQIYSSGNYVGHDMAPDNVGSSYTYSVQWTAPAAGTGDVTFYAGMVAGNGNGSTTGDGAMSVAVTISEAVAACQDVFVYEEVDIVPPSPTDTVANDTMVIIGGCDTFVVTSYNLLFVTANLNLFLEGPYMDNGMMNTSANMFIPLSSPYSAAPYNAPSAMATSGIPSNAVDWVLVEARSGTPSASSPRATVTVAKESSFLLEDGSIVGPDGNALRFAIDANESYHIAVRHRNHLDVISSTSIMPSNSTLTYDFTSAITQALGSFQLKEMSNNKAAMYAGDYENDHVIQTTDYDSWAVEPAILNSYDPTDGNVDGVVQVTDYDTWFENKAKIGNHELEYD